MSNRGILRSRTGHSRWPWSVKNREEEQHPNLSDDDARVLSARDEKEVNERPDIVNLDAKPGLQKAEAVALIWNKKIIVCLLAWYVPKFMLPNYLPESWWV